MKIYFCGSIRGGYQDAKLYQAIIGFMKRKHKVLTEHIGKSNIGEIEKEQTDEDIYLQDRNWLEESDIVIAECTTPSLGVGYELAYAESKKKPVHIFYDRTRTKLSAMLQGDRYFHVHPYEKEEDIFEVLSSLLGIED